MGKHDPTLEAELYASPLIYDALAPACLKCGSDHFFRSLVMIPMRFVATCAQCGDVVSCEQKPYRTAPKKPPPPRYPGSPFDGYFDPWNH